MNHLYNGRTKRRCFAYGMVGHVVKDCWNSVKGIDITAKPETGNFFASQSAFSPLQNII